MAEAGAQSGFDIPEGYAKPADEDPIFKPQEPLGGSVAQDAPAIIGGEGQVKQDEES